MKFKDTGQKREFPVPSRYEKKRIKWKSIAYQMLGGGKCRRCGCDVEEFLEINHINGKQLTDRRANRHGQFQKGVKKFWSGVEMHKRIALGKRPIDDLEILCRVCNALDYLKKKNAEKATHFIVMYKA